MKETFLLARTQKLQVSLERQFPTYQSIRRHTPKTYPEYVLQSLRNSIKCVSLPSNQCQQHSSLHTGHATVPSGTTSTRLYPVARLHKSHPSALVNFCGTLLGPSVKVQSRGLFLSTIPLASLFLHFRRSVNEFALLGCYSALIGSYQCCWTILLSRFQGWSSPLGYAAGCPETSVPNYQSTLRNIPHLSNCLWPNTSFADRELLGWLQLPLLFTQLQVAMLSFSIIHLLLAYNVRLIGWFLTESSLLSYTVDQVDQLLWEGFVVFFSYFRQLLV